MSVLVVTITTKLALPTCAATRLSLIGESTAEQLNGEIGTAYR
jgi:hypothetical protein